MQLKNILSFLLISILLTNISLYSQEDTIKVYRFELRNGATIEGIVKSETEENIYINSLDEVEIIIKKDLIEKREETKKFIVENKIVRLDPTKTKLFLASTAQTLNGGSGYFSVYEIFFPNFALGITDNLMIAGGSSLFPGISLEQQLKFISTKLKLIDYKQIKFSIGGMYLNFWEGSFGTIYGVTTIGKYPIYLTAAVGSGFTEAKFIEGKVIIVGLQYQVSHKISLLTENWFFTNDPYPLISYGLRFFGDNLSADFGFFAKTDLMKNDDMFYFYPWIGFTYNF